MFAEFRTEDDVELREIDVILKVCW